MINATTFKDYLKVPLEQRERFVWWWPCKWYTTPIAMAWTSSKLDGSEWDKFYNYIKEVYPIQYWLRNEAYNFFSYTIVYRFKSFKQKIKHYIINPRKKMRKAVFPSTYWDLATHIIQFHIQCVIEFVEKEKCFEVNDWNCSDEVKRLRSELKEAYDYCKTGRAILQADLDKAWERVASPGPYDIIYKEVNEKEAWLNECDTKLCKWVVENRFILWT